MITLKPEWALYLNILAAIILIASIADGFRKGLLRTLINLLRHVIAIVAGLLLARPLANVFPMLNFKTQGVIEPISNALAVEGSVLIWFVIVFFVVLLLTAILDKLFESLEDIPILGSINQLAGLVGGFVIGWINLMILCMLLVTPLFKNGQELIDKSYLKTVQDTGKFIEPLKNSEIFQRLSNDEKLKTDEAKTLEELLTEYNLNEQQLTEFLEGLKK